MLNYEEHEKLDKIGKAIAQTIPFIIGFTITYFVVEFLGIGDWVRKNSIWLITFTVVILGIVINNLAEWITEIIKHNASNDNDLLFEKLKDLEFDIAYIKNSIKDLKAN